MNSNDDHLFDDNAAKSEPLDASQLAESRLTAYVLGELNTDEQAAVEKELADSEMARQQVSDIRRSVEMLTAALATEQTTALAPGRRDQLLAHIAAKTREAAQTFDRQRRPRKSIARYVLAASVLVCLAGTFAALLLPAKQGAREAARRASARNNLFQLEDRVRSERIVQANDLQAESAGDRSHYKGMATEIEYPDAAQGGPQSGAGRQGAQMRETGASGDASTKNVPYTVGRTPKTPPEGAYTVSKPTYEAEGVAKTPLPDVRLVTTTVDRLSDLARQQIVAEGEARDHINRELFAQRHKGEQSGEFNTESYSRIYENPFLDVRQNPLSTFSIDVDTASYANLRRFLNSGSLPPKDAVRIEEMVNYFTYQYAPPNDDKPFAVHAEVAGCPWQPKHRLLRIALKGREIDLENRPASNLVFLIDVSGSMDNPAKLPLLKNALHLLVDKLAENDRVAMVVYAGSSGLVLPSTSGLYKQTILSALDQLQAGGSTNGGSGIQLAYKVAREKFIKGGTNRVILCTDGDFNVGVTDQGSLTRLIEEEAKSGVFLSVLGFGAGNLKDSTMEQLADRGNGNYAYIDTPAEARKVLVEQLGGTLVTIAKDVKLQLELNPAQVAAYRLIGYENRLLRAEDFNDDKKDAGEIGAGHTVTAFYELVPGGGEVPAATVDGLKYQRPAQPADGASDELLTLKLRYKEPEGETSKLIETAVKDAGKTYPQASEDFQFAAAAAGFGLLLRDSQYKGDLTFGAVIELAQASRGADASGYRAEMIELAKQAQSLSR